METVKQLEAKIQSLIAELDGLTPGSEEHKARLDELNKLGGVLRDLKSVEYEEEDNYRNYGIKLEQMQTDKIDRIVTHSLTVVSLLTSVGLAYWTFKFDEKGTVTSTLGRQILQKFIPKK